MYSGTTLTKSSGRIIGAHQKIDRLAKQQLIELIGRDKQFPALKQILHFEGCNGPDAIKRKSPAKDELWHYFQPFDPEDTELLEIIRSHYRRLVVSLKQNDEIRSAFEAAWLAHAIVDGLTPAHHYPYGQKIIELRGGEGLESRTTIKDKIMMPGKSVTQQVLNNWKFWGPKGLLMTHAAFEIGIATMIKPLKIKRNICTGNNLFVVTEENIEDWYREVAQSVAKLEIYDRFYQKGWTRNLAIEVKKQLIPTIVQTVTLSWNGAVLEASQ